MKKLARTSSRWLGACAALVIASGWNGASRADIAYGYATQSVNNIVVSGAGLTNTLTTGTSTSAAAAINGAGVSTNNPTDTLEAYIGAAPPAPQNFFSKYSTAGGGPQAGDFSRGDGVITGSNLFTTGFNTSNVAESVVSTTGSGLGTATGSWNIAGSFNAPTTGSVTVGYSFSNDILSLVSGIGSSSASFKVTISVKDQHGHEVDATPVELNTALSAPPNGVELIKSGTGSAVLSLSSLTTGDTFGIAISGTELSSVILTSSVPEPGPIVLAGLSGALALAFRAFRGRTRKV